MKKFIVILLWTLLNVSLVYASWENFFEIDVPDGYELCDIEEEGIEDNEPQSRSLAKSFYKASESEPDVNLALATLGSGPSAVVANCVNAITGDFFDSQIDLSSNRV